MSLAEALKPGRTAVITGGAGGIGLAAARRFAASGMKVASADLDDGALAAAAATIGNAAGDSSIEVQTVR